MFIKHSSLILAASLVIAGCSSNALQSPKEQYGNAFIEPAQAQRALSQKQPCCNSFQELQYQEINSDEDLLIPLTEDSQVYSFPSGKSFVQAYKLNTKGAKLKLNINSYIYNTTLAPQLTLLDADFNITRTISAKNFTYKEAKLLNGDTLSAEITVYRAQANNSANETYLLFYTTDKAIAGTTTVIHPAKSFAKAHRTVIPRVADPVIPHSAAGLIELEIDVEGSKVEAENSYIPAAVKSAGGTISTKPMSHTEIEYNQAIIQAVSAKKIDKALTMVELAEAAGFTTARETFINALKNGD